MLRNRHSCWFTGLLGNLIIFAFINRVPLIVVVFNLFNIFFFKKRIGMSRWRCVRKTICCWWSLHIRLLISNRKIVEFLAYLAKMVLRIVRWYFFHFRIFLFEENIDGYQWEAQKEVLLGKCKKMVGKAPFIYY